ncbi:MAG: hypothetical protein IRZ16_03095 [Myxococcaceae bacterium]|nr:hypothetical protein [Myxococcaceae bacterium]
MIGRLLLWARRNSRKAIALAILPGLILLGADAWIAHFVGVDSDNLLQWIPVIYSALGLVLLIVAVVPKSRAFFAWVARIVGALGVVTGLAGTVLHLVALKTALDGDYSWANLQGTLHDSPPVGAPLGFAGIGAVVFLLPSAKLLLRLKVGKPSSASTAAAPVVPLDEQRKVG